jgi:hypothetical protein
MDKNDIIDIISVFFHKSSRKNFTASVAVNKKNRRTKYIGGLAVFQFLRIRLEDP